MQNVFGGLMLGCGILIAGLSGICTLLAFGTAFLDPNNAEKGEILSAIPAVLAIAGIPFAIGVGLFFGGRALMKSAGKPAPAQAAAAEGEVASAHPADKPPTPSKPGEQP